MYNISIASSLSARYPKILNLLSIHVHVKSLNE